MAANAQGLFGTGQICPLWPGMSLPTHSSSLIPSDSPSEVLPLRIHSAYTYQYSPAEQRRLRYASFK